MDPITAFQVAASVITFVDFSRQLVLDAQQLRSSSTGRLPRTMKVVDIDKHLATAREGIEKTLRDVPDGALDEPIRQLCQQCGEISTQLQHVVQKLTATGTTKVDFVKSSFVVAAKSIWYEGQVNALKEQLDGIRSQMMMTTLASVM
jgi:hypothetical protein